MRSHLRVCTCAFALVDCKREIARDELHERDCKREIARERDCKREIAREGLQEGDCKREIESGPPPSDTPASRGPTSWGAPDEQAGGPASTARYPARMRASRQRFESGRH